MSNEECEMCNKTKCPKECFDSHVGSMIALQKLFDELNVKGHIATGNPEPIETVKER